MNIGVLTARERDFHPNMRLCRAAARQGHKIVLINPYHMLSGICKNRFEFEIVGTDTSLDLVLPRQGSPMGDYGLAIIRQLEHLGVPLVNGLRGVTIARNQYITLQAVAAAGIRVPETFFLTDNRQFIPALERLGGYPVILKQVDGMGGEGVLKVESFDAAERFMDRHMPAKKGLVVQQFIPPEGRRDIRMFVIGDRVAGAMTLTPMKDDFRANIHQNGSARLFVPGRDMERTAVLAANACCLDIAGVDLIIGKGEAPRVLEVNYAPGFRGIEAATGIDIADRVIRYATTMVKQGIKKI